MSKNHIFKHRMPPKRKTNKDKPTQKTPNPTQNTSTAAVTTNQHPIAESQEQNKPATVANTPLAKLAQVEQAKLSQQKIILDQERDKRTKISIDEVSKMSEAERIQLRKMRFGGTLGTDTTLHEAEKIKEERLKKFGSTSSQNDRDILEQRKLKFSNSVASIEDPDVVKRRQEKFGLVGGDSNQDRSVLEERKKKFSNPEGEGVSLDEQIAKTKNKLIKKPKKFMKEYQQLKGHHISQPFRQAHQHHQHRSDIRRFQGPQRFRR